LAVLRLMKRSMTSAKARMEHATRGQMGQPAACMMENKGTFSAQRIASAADYRVLGGCRINPTGCRTTPTEVVDNFVQKPTLPPREPAPILKRDRTMTN
jgi:hypothetical protein